MIELDPTAWTDHATWKDKAQVEMCVEYLEKKTSNVVAIDRRPQRDTKGD